MSAQAIPVAAAAPQFGCRYLTESPVDNVRKHQIRHILYQTAAVVMLVALAVLTVAAIATGVFMAGLPSLGLLLSWSYPLQIKASQHREERDFEQKVVDEIAFLQGPGASAEFWASLRATCPEIPAEPGPFLPLIARYRVLRKQAECQTKVKMSPSRPKLKCHPPHEGDSV